MRQSWRDLLFAHWRVPASALRPLVPSQLRIQEFNGSSWVGVVPFRMEGVMVRGLPDLPWFSAFPELNVRLYVEHGDKAGVWFVSLDATNVLAVAAARLLFQLPYFVADMEVEERRERVHYRSIRRNVERRIAFQASYWPSSPRFEPEPGTLEHFLTERYCLYSQTASGTLLRAEIHHQPWPLQHAGAEIAENSMAQEQGISGEGDAVFHFSRRQDVVVWPPYPVSDGRAATGLPDPA